MPLARLLIIAALVTASAAPATAAAGAREKAPASQAHALMVRAAAVAEQVWGRLPCGGQVRLLDRRAVPSELHSDTNAWVTFGSDLGDNDLAAPPSGYTRCTVSFARAQWPSAAVMTADWDLLCMTMAHEIGHLLGHGHDSSPGSVMNPVFSDYSAEPRACRASRPSFETRHRAGARRA